MATNKNASIRYRALDKCFRDYRHRYYIDDLIDKCEEELESFNFTANVSRRQIFDDIRFMESQAGWSIPLDRLKDGKKTYYRYYERDFTINEQPLTDKEAQQLKTMILTLDRFRGLPSNEWIDELVSSLEYRFNLKGKKENVIGFEQNQQRYKYNGKEFDRMHGLDWYDYGARWMDASIGRRHSMDPLCEKYYSVSPYVYCMNNPVMCVDPDGHRL